ncbi:hypothetical protein HS7_02030 [Sulfolobales archaeon HS-7]|nr:hypothetical protein HS7_02030 [Sulfolobales archaeon HS-7]
MAVELRLKGVLIQNTGAVTYIPSIRRLLREKAKVENITLGERVFDCAEYLSLMYLGSRYPGEEVIDLERSEAEKCVRCMEEILSLLT